MKAPKRKPNYRNSLIRLLLVAILLSTTCLAGIAAFFTVRQLTISLANLGDLGPKIVQKTRTPQLNAQGTPLPDSDLPPGSQLESEVLELAPWDGAGRVTILLLGLDYRDWAAEEGPSRSDTMILLTLDPLTQTAGMLSIPRDLWVSIPGFKHGKINTAYYLGDAYTLPGGGPGLAVKTVEQFLGVPINYYAQVDFGAFVRFIDEIGGVKVDVPEAITIDLLGSGFKTKKKLQPGVQLLPGEWALAYARARYTEGGDFDRAQRQQQVIMGIRDRILSLDMLPTLISKAPTLYNELASGIRTNLTLDEVIKLALLAQDVREKNIQSGIISEEEVFFGFSPDGLSILIPIPDDIHQIRDQIFATSGSLGPATPGTLQKQMQAEAARVALFNGSSALDLGTRTSDYLRGQSVNITQVGNASQPYAATTIIDHTGNPYIMKYLVDLLHIHSSKIYIEFDPNSQVDVEVYLGADWASNNSLP
ncbi:MAG: LCP family protein [Anaerolineales bacterium]|nr:LCP family protein [Anaerolineales bacterium]